LERKARSLGLWLSFCVLHCYHPRASRQIGAFEAVVRVPCKLYILGGDEVYYVLLSLIANTVIRILGFGGELLQVIFSIPMAYYMAKDMQKN
jgi:N-glycosylase/DNA lyase